ncbi:MAG: DUF6776 family protein [Pseudomonadota bacterium]
MLWQKLRTRRRRDPQYKVVEHRPWRRAFMLTLLGGVVLGAVLFGYWLGAGVHGLDRSYLTSLEARDRANQRQINALNGELADVRLARSVQEQAAQSLRRTITRLRDRLAGLEEEVVFYKSLMAPSQVEQGLQIAEFELTPGPEDGQFAYQILLTQVAERRGWVKGGVEVEVRGIDMSGDTGVEEVLPLTELTAEAPYPLEFRFRYFQDLSGRLTLPEDFRPRSVRITATPTGGSAEQTQRSFEWLVQAG